MRSLLYLKSFLNYLNRNKLYTFITVFGFSVSLMFVVVLGLYVYEEFTVDSKRENAKDIYLLQDNVFSLYSYKFGDQLIGAIPDVSKITRMVTDDFVLIDPDKNTEIKVVGCITDASIFDVLSFDVIAGDPQQPMPDIRSVSLSQQFAEKLYGSQSPIGKDLILNGFPEKIPVTVASVFKDVENSGFKAFDILFNIEYSGDIYGDPDFKNSHNVLAYDIVALVNRGADMHSAEQLIPVIAPDFTETVNRWRINMGVTDSLTFRLQRLDGDYFTVKPANFASKSRKYNSKQEVYILFSISILLLIFSLINYINLSVAQTKFRLKEFAMRKLLGGTKAEVFLSLLCETLILCICSFVIALFLAYLSIPFFNAMMKSAVSLQALCQWHVAGFVLLLIVLISLISGLFPAYQIFRVNPIAAIKGVQEFTGAKFIFGRLLLFVQFFITSLLLSGTIIMFSQLRLIQQGDLGFNRTGVLNINVNTNKEAVYDAIGKIKGVSRLGKARGVPVFQGPQNGTKINNSDEHYFFRYMLWDKQVFSIFGVGIAQAFDDSQPAGVWFDQYTWNHLPIDKSDRDIKLYNQNHNIKGVLRDFRFKNVMDEKEFLYLRELKNDENWLNLVVELSTNDMSGTLNDIREAYKEATNGGFLDMEFFDDAISASYSRENQVAEIIGYISLSSIVLAIMGIFGMSVFVIQSRLKEIIVRRVFGSTIPELLIKLLRDTGTVVLVSFIASVPVTIWFMKDWLARFDLNVGFRWYFFVIAFAIIFTLSLLSIFWHSLKAASVNPATKLRIQ